MTDQLKTSVYISKEQVKDVDELIAMLNSFTNAVCVEWREVGDHYTFLFACDTEWTFDFVRFIFQKWKVRPPQRLSFVDVATWFEIRIGYERAAYLKGVVRGRKDESM